MRQIQAFLAAAVLAALCFSPLAGADELTEIIQKDLVVLGYDPGNISGEMTMETVVAISKFQAENSLEVTGEASPQLAGIIKARISGRSGGAVAAAPAQPDPAALRAAQQACLEEKVAAAEKPKKKRGFGSLVRAVANTASRYGGGDLTRAISETSRDVYDANATADDWARAAEDLGLTTDDIEDCQNPSL